MRDSFSVGEIAIAVAPPYADKNLHCNGAEVEILGPLCMQYTRGGGDYMGYLVRAPIGEVCCRPEYLRKRRPPQDWVKLCRLTDLPREVSHV